MTNGEIIRLSSASNAAVVQLPERKNPGVVVQGDSLRNLRTLLDEALHELDEGKTNEARELVTEIGEILQEYLDVYAQATSLAERR